MRASSTPSLLDAQAAGVGQPARGEHHRIGLQLLTVLQGGGQGLPVSFDVRDVGIESEVDTLLAHFVGKGVPDVDIEPAQEQRAAIELGDLGAEPIEDAGELHRDVAPAHDDHTPGHLRQVKRLVGGDGVLLAGKVRDRGPAAGGHKYIGGRDLLARDLHGMRIQHPGPGLEQFDAVAVEQAAVDRVEARDLLVLVADQRGPVEGALAHGPAEAGGVLEVVGEVGAVDQQLLGNAADVDAGAAQVAFFRHRHARAVDGRHTAGAYAPGARADGEQVVVVACVRAQRMPPSGD